jgi:hypothetical protein
MNFKDVVNGLQEDAKTFGKEPVNQSVDMFALWHGFMRAYGYIPYDDFMNKMDCYQSVNLLLNMKKEGDYINKEMNKTKSSINRSRR